MTKFIIFILFGLIITSLGVALFNLVKPKDDASSAKTLKALMFRIGLSLLLFIGLFIAANLGWIKPHGIGSRIHHANQPSDKPTTESRK